MQAGLLVPERQVAGIDSRFDLRPTSEAHLPRSGGGSFEVLFRPVKRLRLALLDVSMVIEYENHFPIFWFVQLRVRTVSSSYGHLCERADPQFNQYRGRKKVFDKTPITEDTMNNDFPLPYEGVRVLDVSQGFAGPYCAALLAAQGANVVKVEPPRGDWIREIGEAYDGITPWTVVANSGKRSICIDATQPQGRGSPATSSERCGCDGAEL